MQDQSPTEPITAKNYHQRAGKFIEAMSKDARKSLPTIEMQSAEMASWQQYFDRHLGWRPVSLTMLLLGRIRTMTVPTQWPQWFDSAYVEDPAWQAPKPGVPRHLRPTYSELMARFRAGPDEGVPNTFVPDHVDAYQAMLERHERTGGQWSRPLQRRCLDDVVRWGLVVPRKWLGADSERRRSTFTAPNDAYLRAYYSQQAHDTAPREPAP